LNAKLPLDFEARNALRSRNHPAPKDTPPQATKRPFASMNQADALATG